MGQSEIANEAELAWQLAQQALEKARAMPGGLERVEALKRAGKLRFDADQLRQAQEWLRRWDRSATGGKAAAKGGFGNSKAESR
jgi:hypothetical protein